MIMVRCDARAAFIQWKHWTLNKQFSINRRNDWSCMLLLFLCVSVLFCSGFGANGCLLAAMYWRISTLWVVVTAQCPSIFRRFECMHSCVWHTMWYSFVFHLFTCYSLYSVSIRVAFEPPLSNFVVYIWERTIKMQYRTVMMLILKLYDLHIIYGGFITQLSTIAIRTEWQRIWFDVPSKWLPDYGLTTSRELIKQIKNL